MNRIMAVLRRFTAKLKRHEGNGSIEGLSESRLMQLRTAEAERQPTPEQIEFMNMQTNCAGRNHHLSLEEQYRLEAFRREMALLAEMCGLAPRKRSFYEEPR